MSSVFEGILTPESIVSSSGVLTRQCIQLYQELVELIEEPCFLFFKGPDPTLVANRQIARLLGYATLNEFYKHELKYEHLLNNKELKKITKAADEITKYRVNKLIQVKMLRHDSTYVKCLMYLKPLFDTDGKLIHGYLGTVQINEKKSSPLIRTWCIYSMKMDLLMK